MSGDRLRTMKPYKAAAMRNQLSRPDAWYRTLRIAVGAATIVSCFVGDTLASDASKGLAKAAICASCHGPVGVSPVPTYPNIAGQNPMYLEYALRRYRAGERSGDQAGMMYTVTQALSDTDISELAAYYGQLRPHR
jgi:cytochrome c553